MIKLGKVTAITRSPINKTPPREPLNQGLFVYP